MDCCDILVVNPCGRTGELVAGSLLSRGLRASVLEAPSPRRDEPGFLRALKSAVRETGAGMIVPVFFPEVLAAHREEFPGVMIPVESPERLRLLDNKLSACRLAAELGIPQPKVLGASDCRGLPGLGDGWRGDGFPVVFKRAEGQGGDSVYFPRSRKALSNLIASSGEYLVTEFVEGCNVCVDAIRAEGLFRASAYRVLAPLGKGVSTEREIVSVPVAVEHVRRLLDAVDYRGVCEVDFRMSPDGDLFFLECNPRFSGGLQTTLEAGLDLPLLLYELCLAGRLR